MNEPHSSSTPPSEKAHVVEYAAVLPRSREASTIATSTREAPTTVTKLQHASMRVTKRIADDERRRDDAAADWAAAHSL